MRKKVSNTVPHIFPHIHTTIYKKNFLEDGKKLDNVLKKKMIGGKSILQHKTILYVSSIQIIVIYISLLIALIAMLKPVLDDSISGTLTNKACLHSCLKTELLWDKDESHGI